MRELDADRAEELVAVYREHNLRRHDDLLRPYPGVAAMLAGLRGRRARLGIVTSKMRAAVDAGMSLVPLGEFDAIVTCEDTDRHKPDPAPVLHALALLDADRRTTVYVGDSPYDVRAGRGSGRADGGRALGRRSRRPCCGPSGPTASSPGPRRRSRGEGRDARRRAARA